MRFQILKRGSFKMSLPPQPQIEDAIGNCSSVFDIRVNSYQNFLISKYHLFLSNASFEFKMENI